MANVLINRGNVAQSQSEEKPMSHQRIGQEEEKIPRQWAFCISHPQGRLLQTDKDYREAEEHRKETGEEWFDCPTKAAAAIKEAQGIANEKAIEDAEEEASKLSEAEARIADLEKQLAKKK